MRADIQGYAPDLVGPSAVSTLHSTNASGVRPSKLSALIELVIDFSIAKSNFSFSS